MVEGKVNVPNLTVDTKDLTDMFNGHVLGQSLDTNFARNNSVPDSTN